MSEQLGSVVAVFVVVIRSVVVLMTSCAVVPLIVLCGSGVDLALVDFGSVGSADRVVEAARA